MADREMANEEAIEILGGIRACYNIFDEYDEPKYAALSKAIYALKAVGDIKEIINISNFAIQEDVLKYKMICEVVEKMEGGENRMGDVLFEKACDEEYDRGYEDGMNDAVKHGRWLRTDAYPHRIYCSECYATFIRNDEFLKLNDIPHDYCPNCGARMFDNDTDVPDKNVGKMDEVEE